MNAPIRRVARGTGRRGYASLVWGIFFFLATQLALTFFLDRGHSEVYDPEYGYRLARLRARLAAEPQRPLLLVLGSSRVELGLRPEALPQVDTAPARTPLVFNFGLTGAGPVTELVYLRRLLAAGIRPRYLAIEVLPPALYCDDVWGEEQFLNRDHLAWDDLPLLQSYFNHTTDLHGRWLTSRLACTYTYRQGLLSRYLPGWLPLSSRLDAWRVNVSPSGWLAYERTTVDAVQVRHGQEFARRQYARALANFHIAEAPDRALREMLEACRREQITPMLLVMPEGSAFRGWYPPAARARIDGYLARLGRDYGVTLLDARTWVADEEFFDGHHLLPSGATAFTERFGPEMTASLPK